MSSNLSTKITLKAGGPRELVSESEAQDIAERFRHEISRRPDVTVETLDLSCRSWRRSALEVLRPVLEEIVETVKILKIDDIIASLPTEEGLESLQFFAEVFGSSQVLQEIDLNDNALGSRGDVVLAPLFKLKTLERLAIENCGMSQEVAASLLQSLSLSAPTLTHLSLGRNQIGAEGARHVGALLATCSNLVSLNYNGCRPLKAGTAHVLQGLAQMVLQRGTTVKSMVHLNLHDCTIGSDDEDEDSDSSLNNLVTIIAHSPKLKVLNLQDGEIGAYGLERVLDALRDSTARLTVLALGGCELGEEGAKLLAKAIYDSAVLQELETLRMDTNELGDDGVSTLVEAMAATSSCIKLQSLDLETNDISRKGALALLHHKIPHLQSLILTDNMDIPADVAKKLKAVYASVLVDDDLEDGNDEDEEEVDELADQLAGANI